MSNAPSNRNEINTLSNCVNENKKGRESAMIPQIFGIKSSKKTRRAKNNAYSSQNISIIIKLTKPFERAKRNFTQK